MCYWIMPWIKRQYQKCRLEQETISGQSSAGHSQQKLIKQGYIGLRLKETKENIYEILIILNKKVFLETR
jgi:hypothetical protein